MTLSQYDTRGDWSMLLVQSNIPSKKGWQIMLYSEVSQKTVIPQALYKSEEEATTVANEKLKKVNE